MPTVTRRTRASSWDSGCSTAKIRSAPRSAAIRRATRPRSRTTGASGPAVRQRPRVATAQGHRRSSRTPVGAVPPVAKHRVRRYRGPQCQLGAGRPGLLLRSCRRRNPRGRSPSPPPGQDLAARRPDRVGDDHRRLRLRDDSLSCPGRAGVVHLRRSRPGPAAVTGRHPAAPGHPRGHRRACLRTRRPRRVDPPRRLDQPGGDRRGGRRTAAWALPAVRGRRWRRASCSPSPSGCWPATSPTSTFSTCMARARSICSPPRINSSASDRWRRANLRPRPAPGIILGIYALTRAWGRVAAVGCATLSAILVLTPIGLSALAWNGGVGLGLWSIVLALRARRTDNRWSTIGSAALAGLALTFRPDLAVALGVTHLFLGVGRRWLPPGDHRCARRAAAVVRPPHRAGIGP